MYLAASTRSQVATVQHGDHGFPKWEGPLGPDSFPEPVFEFPPQHKSEFTNETPLRQYDNRREPWPKCRHGEDCLVQMCTDGMDGSRRFFKCPHAWVILGSFISLSSMRHLT